MDIYQKKFKISTSYVYSGVIVELLIWSSLDMPRLTIQIPIDFVFLSMFIHIKKNIFILQLFTEIFDFQESRVSLIITLTDVKIEMEPEVPW